MLVNLHVKNLALIEEADIGFSDGLNIITGETGAGKSILIGSINAALGNKVPADFVRSGAQYGLVELTFVVKDKSVLKKLKELEVMDLEEGQVIITRRITAGRSTIKINGELRVAAEVRKVAALLIDIHGQHEHQSLLNTDNYLPLIDQYARKELGDVKTRLQAEYAEYKKLKKQFEEYHLDPESLTREMSFMEYEIQEIEAAALKAGEDEELEQTFKLYHNSRKIMEGISQAVSLLSQSEVNAMDNVSHALKAVSQVADYDREHLDGILSQLSDVEDILNGLNGDLESYADKMNFDENEYRNLEERLSLINSLKQKYGKTIEQILQYQKERSEKLAKFHSYEENKAQAERALGESKESVLILCHQITEIRKQAAQKLSEEIKKALLELNFLEVQFETCITETEKFDEQGCNEADFLISTNPGEKKKPLSKVASGGELSRIMLAIKTVLSDKDAIESLIFDEIDTGISGRTAQMVAVKLKENSRHHQVLCITHLPQIAAMADSHFVIEKHAQDNKTTTTIEELDKEQSVLELARLLGGSAITDQVIGNAREMKELAMQTKIC